METNAATLLLKISAIASGSFVAISAQASNTLSTAETDLSTYGGWSIAVIGLITLWRQLVKEREILSETLKEVSKTHRAEMDKLREHADKMIEASNEERKLSIERADKSAYAFREALAKNTAALSTQKENCALAKQIRKFNEDK